MHIYSIELVDTKVDTSQSWLLFPTNARGVCEHMHHY